MQDGAWVQQMLSDLLGRVEQLKAAAAAQRGTPGEAQIRAQVLEAAEGAELLLDALTELQMTPYVESTIDWDEDVPLELGMHVEHARREFSRAHHYSRGWVDAQPELAESTRPAGLLFDDRADAFGYLAGGLIDHVAFGRVEEYRVSVAAIGYTVGHGWHQKITDAELDDLVRQFAPDLVPKRPEQIDAGSASCCTP